VPGWDDAVDLEKAPAVVPDAATTPVPAELRAEIETYMARYPDFRSAAIPALHAAQRLHGWCSPTAIEQVACVMRLTPGYLTAVATFYDMFETTPKGPVDVYVCTNISCSLRGADKVYAAMLEVAGNDPEFHVKSFECLGACDIAPMASVDGEYVGPLEESDCARIVEDVRAGRPVLEGKQLRHKKVAGT
jgi:NADH:ubiquinone oxidoreductase subunit E